MKKYELTICGYSHPQGNEDFYVSEYIDDQVLVLGVMDGCSSGKESRFASALIGKLIRKAVKELGAKYFVEKKVPALDIVIKEIIEIVFNALDDIKNNLHLTTNELLSTLLVSVVDVELKNVAFTVLGDGVVSYNGAVLEFDQGDAPDYLAYHLEKDFEEWYADNVNAIVLGNCSDFSLSSDGIYSFFSVHDINIESSSENQFLRTFLIDEIKEEKPKYFQNKLTEIEEDFGMVPWDDFTLLRVVWE